MPLFLGSGMAVHGWPNKSVRIVLKLLQYMRFRSCAETNDELMCMPLMPIALSMMDSQRLPISTFSNMKITLGLMILTSCHIPKIDNSLQQIQIPVL